MFRMELKIQLLYFLWSKSEKLPTGFESPYLFLIGKYVYFFGGINPLGILNQFKIWKFNLETYKFKIM